jgi:hypothetical protein
MMKATLNASMYYPVLYNSNLLCHETHVGRGGTQAAYPIHDTLLGELMLPYQHGQHSALQ